MIKSLTHAALSTDEPLDDEPHSDRNVTVRWYAAGSSSRREPLSLRYHAYHASGLLETSPWGIYTDPYDEVPTTLLAGLYRHGACIATLRLCMYHPGADGPSMPCETIYPEIEAIKARATGTVVELSRLAMDPSITNQRYRARLYAAAIRTAMTACLALEVDQMLVATQLKWRRFYERVLGFDAVSAPQLYPPGDNPIILLSRKLDTNARQRMMNNMFFKFDEAEIADVRAAVVPLLAAKATV